MKHKYLKYLFLGAGVCSFLVSSPTRAETDEGASEGTVDQVQVSLDRTSQLTVSSEQYPLAKLEVSAAAHQSPPVQEMSAGFGVYSQPENAAFNKAPDPPVFILVLIGLLGLLIVRRRFR